MIALLCFFLTLFASPFKSKSRLEAISRPIQRTGSIISHALLGGLHHQYVRV
jgi:hypothetical protein